MSFNSWGYEFEGAYIDSNQLQARGGAYVVWCRNGDNWKVLDVGEAQDVRERLLNHERTACWRRNCTGIIYYSAHYTDGIQALGRRQIEQFIRNQTNPPCGEY